MMQLHKMKIELEIKGMHCLDCAMKIEQAVAGLRGVRAARVDFGTARLVVDPEGKGPDPMTIRRQVEALGYQMGETTGALTPRRPATACSIFMAHGLLQSR